MDSILFNIDEVLLNLQKCLEASLILGDTLQLYDFQLVAYKLFLL